MLITLTNSTNPPMCSEFSCLDDQQLIAEAAATEQGDSPVTNCCESLPPSPEPDPAPSPVPSSGPQDEHEQPSTPTPSPPVHFLEELYSGSCTDRHALVASHASITGTCAPVSTAYYDAWSISDWDVSYTHAGTARVDNRFHYCWGSSKSACEASLRTVERGGSDDDKTTAKSRMGHKQKPAESHHTPK